jgi:hypothetical protein
MVDKGAFSVVIIMKKKQLWSTLQNLIGTNIVDKIKEIELFISQNTQPRMLLD